MKIHKLLLLFLIFFGFFSCKEEKQDQLIVEMEKKNAMAFEKISKAWVINIPPQSPEVKMEISKWKEWQSFEQDLKQKPKASISAFKLKVEALQKKSDSLHLFVPAKFNEPQVRSRIIAMQTKLQALDTYFSLDIVPQDKVERLIRELNQEIMAFYSQCEELIIKNKIPVEDGEKELINALDTTRHAKNMDFDEFERKQIQDKTQKK
ncbi:hypothetical protein [Flavobacterium sp.]|jgi:hypothetical protein|uniref:hypothetical protein n=1 Tax=Flavobacterium sp. TaxID=239 RepID=UPI0037C08A05